MITIDQVSKWYGSTQVLKRCSTAVAKGEVVVVCGPSGSGKSTQSKCVNGLEPFQEGAIMVDGISVGDRKTNLSKLRARIGMVFQHFELFPHLTVMRNLELAQVKVLGRDKEESAERGMRLLDRIGLREHAQKFPGQLSGGQQQRVAIARALASEGMTMMVVTHEMGFARRVAHRVVFMDRGEIVEDAATAEFFGRPHSERAQTFLSKILQH
jgi:glutamate/aspartate transport system ATP-binding protein